jgi:hypothetical protein
VLRNTLFKNLIKKGQKTVIPAFFEIYVVTKKKTLIPGIYGTQALFSPLMEACSRNLVQIYRTSLWAS